MNNHVGCTFRTSLSCASCDSKTRIFSSISHCSSKHWRFSQTYFTKLSNSSGLIIFLRIGQKKVANFTSSWRCRASVTNASRCRQWFEHFSDSDICDFKTWYFCFSASVVARSWLKRLKSSQKRYKCPGKPVSWNRAKQVKRSPSIFQTGFGAHQPSSQFRSQFEVWFDVFDKKHVFWNNIARTFFFYDCINSISKRFIVSVAQNHFFAQICHVWKNDLETQIVFWKRHKYTNFA